jgi:hypothetical protein
MNMIPGLYHYHRIGHDERPLELLANGLIGDGGSSVEHHWELRNGGNVACLTILGEYGEICRLQLEPDGAWRGAWTQFEKMPVELRLQPLARSKIGEALSTSPSGSTTSAINN